MAPTCASPGVVTGGESGMSTGRPSSSFSITSNPIILASGTNFVHSVNIPRTSPFPVGTIAGRSNFITMVPRTSSVIPSGLISAPVLFAPSNGASPIMLKGMPITSAVKSLPITGTANGQVYLNVSQFSTCINSINNYEVNRVGRYQNTCVVTNPGGQPNLNVNGGKSQIPSHIRNTLDPIDLVNLNKQPFLTKFKPIQYNIESQVPNRNEGNSRMYGNSAGNCYPVQAQMQSSNISSGSATSNKTTKPPERQTELAYTNAPVQQQNTHSLPINNKTMVPCLKPSSSDKNKPPSNGGFKNKLDNENPDCPSVNVESPFRCGVNSRVEEVKKFDIDPLQVAPPASPTRESGVPVMQKGKIFCTTADQQEVFNKMEGLLNVNMDDQRYSVLTFEQAQRLNDVLHEVLPIHGRGNFPTLEIRLRDLVTLVRSKLEADSVTVRDIRLNGGAASFVLSTDGEQAYNDLDLIFAVDLSTQRNFEKVKTAVLESLLDFLPEGVSKKRMSSCSMKEGYVNKMVKVNDSDRWSLISLSNNGGRNVELKFVDKMKRQFEFSVDSFQIVLDSLLLFYNCAVMPISDNFYPTVVGESVYGDFSEALYHLQKKLIATKTPEEIRGGGLLKYCNLLVKDYEPANTEEIKSLERYMCSRFFIDFSDITQQQPKLESYLLNHFVGADESLRYDFLMILHKVVDESTVCLMGHERRQTLTLIDDLACQVYYTEQQFLLYTKHQQLLQCETASTTSSNSSNCSNSSGGFDVHISPPPPVIYSNGYYYAPIVPAPAPPPPQPFPCTCGWLQCA